MVEWFTLFFCRAMKRYAPLAEQPRLGRSRAEMSAGEQAIYDAFTDEAFVGKVLEYLQLEEHKGKDKFHSEYFTIFKVRKAGNVYLYIFITEFTATNSTIYVLSCPKSMSL